MSWRVSERDCNRSVFVVEALVRLCRIPLSGLSLDLQENRHEFNDTYKTLVSRARQLRIYPIHREVLLVRLRKLSRISSSSYPANNKHTCTVQLDQRAVERLRLKEGSPRPTSHSRLSVCIAVCQRIGCRLCTVPVRHSVQCLCRQSLLCIFAVSNWTRCLSF